MQITEGVLVLFLLISPTRRPPSSWLFQSLFPLSAGNAFLFYYVCLFGSSLRVDKLKSVAGNTTRPEESDRMAWQEMVLNLNYNY